MNIGIMGEISPLTVQNFKLRVPVAAIELNISSFLEK
jgi:phenylalanyl-tRNA synthetase beta subunit